jgi:hypothetical protein
MRKERKEKKNRKEGRIEDRSRVEEGAQIVAAADGVDFGSDGDNSRGVARVRQSLHRPGLGVRVKDLESVQSLGGRGRIGTYENGNRRNGKEEKTRAKCEKRAPPLRMAKRFPTTAPPPIVLAFGRVLVEL